MANALSDLCFKRNPNHIFVLHNALTIADMNIHLWKTHTNKFWYFLFKQREILFVFNLPDVILSPSNTLRISFVDEIGNV